MCIAKAHIKLDSLLTGSMIDLVTDLCDANISRKSVPGKMELKIRIRSPLLKCGLVTKTEKWLIVDFKDGNLVSHISQNSSVENDTLNQTIVSQKSASPSKSSISSPQVSKNPTENNSKSSVADIEDLIISFDNPDTISSNHVLETEYNSIVSSINLKRDISPDILDLKQAYEIRMNILVSLVQTGTFTFESYIKGLEESAEVYKTLALKFKESNRADYARKSLVRMKLIKEEIKNMAEETS